MRKKLFFQFSVAFLTTLLFVVTGCQDKDYYDPTVNPDEDKEVSSLDFATSRSVELQMNYNVSVGYVSTFNVYTEYPLTEEGVLNTELEPLTAGIHIAGVSEIKRQLPTFVKELYLYSPDLFIPRLMHAEINNGVASFEQVSVNLPEYNVSTRTVENNKIDYYLKGITDFYSQTGNGFYKYDLIAPDKKLSIPSEVLNKINETFPENQRIHEQYYDDATVEVLSDPGKIGVEIHISVLHAGGQYDNSLSYFVYEGEKDLKDLTSDERKNLELINVFALADVYNNSYKNKGYGLTPGHYIKLKYKKSDGEYVDVFPIGAKIGWVLHSNGFNSSDFTVKSASKAIYSLASWNGNVNKTIFFAAPANNGDVYNCFGFEDEFYGGDNDCNDVIFHVLTNPVNAVNPPPFIPVHGIIRTEAINKGVLAFEDNWPRKGDYDLNDVVVKYHSTVTYVQDGETTEESNGELVGKGAVTVEGVKDVFTFIHTGADFNNGFSYKVNLLPSRIKDLKITDNAGQTVSYTMIPDEEGFIIDLCANVRDVIPSYQVVVDPAVYTVEMVFIDKDITDEEFEDHKAPYNPFIMPENANIASKMIEVHLPFYYPTQRMDLNLFGDYDDVSNPNLNIYYAAQLSVYYPFALNLVGVDNFTIPEENLSIDKSYSNYTNWVNNGCGVIDADWYLYPNY